MKFLLLKNKYLKRILIVITVIVILVLFKILINFSNKTNLNCLTVNNINGDVALSYYKDNYIVIEIFDKFGNKKFQTLEQDNGGVLRNLFYDQVGNLHAFFGRRQIEKIYDSNGDIIAVKQLNYTETDYWKNWEKKGSSYSKTVNRTFYCYDYANFFELLWNPTDVVYLQSEKSDPVLIWTNEKKKNCFLKPAS